VGVVGDRVEVAVAVAVGVREAEAGEAVGLLDPLGTPAQLATVPPGQLGPT
jgi:hypothetical protein